LTNPANTDIYRQTESISLQPSSRKSVLSLST